MTHEAQHALQKIMDNFSSNTRFCIICNYISKIVPELLSRCTRFRFPPLPNKIIIGFIKSVAKQEGIKLNKLAIMSIINISQGDMRQVLNIMQSCGTKSAHLSDDRICSIMFKPSMKKIDQILSDMMKFSIKKRYEYIKEYINESGISIFDLVKYLGNHILDSDSIISDNESFKQIILTLSEIENRSSIDSNEDIQICAFASCFTSV